MGATANNNAVINCHLFYEVVMIVLYNLMILRNLTQKYSCVVEKQFNDIKKFNTEVQLCC